MKKQILVLALSALAAGVASANPRDHHTAVDRSGSEGRSASAGSSVVPAPELDPRSMIAGLTLLTGVAMVLLGRRRITSS
jgi:hypothetical protein